MIKMVASSFYNTLIDKEEAIPMSTMLQIDRIRNNDIKFTILTNRSHNELTYYNKDFPFIDYIVSFNGNYVIDINNNKTIYKNPLTSNKINNILEKYKENKILLYSEDSIYEKETYNGQTIYKIEIELKRKDLNNLESDAITFKFNKKTYLEITESNDYKGLFKLLEILNIKDNELCTVIGNESEKILLTKISNTYIIGNSSKSLKAKTTKKTSSNNFKGVEKIIKKL